MLGQSIRLNRFVNYKRHCVVAALDAGGFFGPYPGLVDIKSTCDSLSESDAILMEPGCIETCRETFLCEKAPVLITRLNWNTKMPAKTTSKRLIKAC